ncbi:MAG TPA: AraC family transcriptional regulator ligand-binding domain-containing protein [Gemmatimonadaceae bacterium]
MSELTVAANAAQVLIDFAVSRGANRATLAQLSGIQPAELDDRENRVPFNKYVDLMRSAQDLCNDPALALHFGECVDTSEISFTHQIGAHSMAEALGIVNRYSRLTVEVESTATDRFTMSRIDGQLWMLDLRANPNDFPELTESSFARMICTTRRAMGDLKMVREVHVTHAAPAYRDEYDRIFRVPVVFWSDKNGFLLDDRVMGLTPPPVPAYSSQVLKSRAEELLTRLDNSKSIRARVEGMLERALQTGDVSMASTARELGLSRQTLFRKLKAEGVTFEKVLDDLRSRMARHYLGSGKMSVSQTAHLLGFSDASSFSRAYKRWIGVSPKATAREKRG